tara:strand:- start:951 stop:1091 length:141 start_codon:yes stop_codon:yes gene_type:complete
MGQIDWKLVAKIREAKNKPYRSGSVTTDWEHYGKVLEAKAKQQKQS